MSASPNALPNHEPRSPAEQRATWHAQAVEVLSGPDQVRDMVYRALRQRPISGLHVNQLWMAQAAEHVLTTVEEHRATWAGLARPCRSATPGSQRRGELRPVEALVDRLVDEVLHRRSVSPARRSDGIIEPPLLRRTDEAIVYTVAGADLYTSTRILAAAQRLLHVAGRFDSRKVNEAAVDVTFLEIVANGVQLNAGQVGLVRSMATFEARLQLAIAPAGTGRPPHCTPYPRSQHGNHSPRNQRLREPDRRAPQRGPGPLPGTGRQLRGISMSQYTASRWP